jgi:hypothetical protein
MSLFLLEHVVCIITIVLYHCKVPNFYEDYQTDV